MTWALILLRMKTGLTALWGIIVRYPWQAAVIALLALSGWLWHGKSVAMAERDSCHAASAESARLAKAQRDAQIAALQQHAKDADHAYQTQTVAARDATDRYVADHRVQPASSPSAAPAAGQGDGAAVPQSLPASPLVAVSVDDLHKCSDATAYAIAAHDWADGLIMDGLGE